MERRAGTRGEKGRRRRDSLAAAAADILLAHGPAALTHRSVAARAGASLSATTYYFADREDLLRAAGERVVTAWATHAEQVAGATTDRTGDALAAVVEAVLPPDERLRGHYEHLVGAGRSPALAGAYASGRQRLDAAVGRILDGAGRPSGPTTPGAGRPSGPTPELVIAVIDGAAVSALSEGRDARALARRLLTVIVSPLS
ncbi:MAG: TetR family transcriptional regulator [Actinomycetales bacterium]|nr:TetR family transcriptional regulator [Actinomycetales bacterium]